jgi:hypothetical protein
MNTNVIALNNDFEISFHRDDFTNSVDLILKDLTTNSNVKIASYLDGGKWNINEFYKFEFFEVFKQIRLSKTKHSIFRKKLFAVTKSNITSNEKTFICFKRKVNIKVTRLFNKIIH